MLNFGNKEFRNMQEQVEKSKEDILKLEQSLGSALPDPIPGPEGPKGPQGEVGPQGERGTGIYGTTENLPSPSSYKYGDLYLLNDGRIFKNIQNRWVPQTNIKGPQGVAGPEGTPVVANPDGEATDDLNTIKIDGVIYTLTFDETTLDGKLDKDTSTSTYTEAYCKLPNGGQYMFPISNAATSNTIPTRTNGGQIKVGDPILNVDAVNLGYLLSNYDTRGTVQGLLSLKQNTLVSGTTIKTINGQSVLGSGNLNVTANNIVWGNITGNISSQADLSNQLALREYSGNKVQDLSTDSSIKYPSVSAVRSFVNSSIQSVAANYITTEDGTIFATKAALLAGPWYHSGEEYTPTNNDYAIVAEDETADDAQYRYSFDGTNWVQQYKLGSTFTAAQQAAIDSGVTSTIISNLQSGLTARGSLIDCELNPTIESLDDGSYFVTNGGMLTNIAGASVEVNYGDIFSKGQYGVGLLTSSGIYYLDPELGSWDNSFAPTKIEIDNALENYVKSTEYATSSAAGVIKTNPNLAFDALFGVPSCSLKTYAQYQSLGANAFISKGTLENVLSHMPSGGTQLYLHKFSVQDIDYQPMVGAYLYVINNVAAPTGFGYAELINSCKAMLENSSYDSARPVYFDGLRFSDGNVTFYVVALISTIAL